MEMNIHRKGREKKKKRASRRCRDKSLCTEEETKGAGLSQNRGDRTHSGTVHLSSE